MSRLILRLARLLLDVEGRVSALEESESTMSSEVDQLSVDVGNLTQAEADAEARVAAEIATLQSQIDALKAVASPEIAPQLAALEATTARLAALAQPQTPPTQAPPAPAPDPTAPAAQA